MSLNTGNTKHPFPPKIQRNVQGQLVCCAVSDPAILDYVSRYVFIKSKKVKDRAFINSRGKDKNQIELQHS